MNNFTKKCSICKEFKEFNNFYKNKGGKFGLRSKCKTCFNEEAKKRSKKRYGENPEHMRGLARKRYILNKEKILERKERYRKNNKEKVREHQKKWRENNTTRINYLSSKRRASKINATPPWAELPKIKILYEKAKWLEKLTGKKYHVDHIVPLQGKDVCGLHIWNNLQILEDKLNLSKSNK